MAVDFTRGTGQGHLWKSIEAGHATTWLTRVWVNPKCLYSNCSPMSRYLELTTWGQPSQNSHHYILNWTKSVRHRVLVDSSVQISKQRASFFRMTNCRLASSHLLTTKKCHHTKLSSKFLCSLAISLKIRLPTSEHSSKEIGTASFMPIPPRPNRQSKAATSQNNNC